MSNLLVRGISPIVYRKIQKMAQKENLSMNQAIIRLIASGLEGVETEEEREKQLRETFRRLKEIREANFRKYGRSEDSTKLIREDRDSR